MSLIKIHLPLILTTSFISRGRRWGLHNHNLITQCVYYIKWLHYKYLVCLCKLVFLCIICLNWLQCNNWGDSHFQNTFWKDFQGYKPVTSKRWMIMCWFILSNLNVSCVPTRPYLIHKYEGEMRIMNFPFRFHISKRCKFSTVLISPPVHLYRNNSMWHFIQVMKY